MKEHSVAVQYANAIYNLAKEKGICDSVYEELNNISRIFKDNAPLFNLLQNPKLSRYEKRAVIERIFSGNVSTVVKEFIYMLIDKQRVEYIQDIVGSFKDLYLLDEGVKEAVIVSAFPLELRLHNRLQEALERLTHTKILLKIKTDSSILGGIIVFIDSKMIDGSVRRRLAELKESFQTAKVK